MAQGQQSVERVERVASIFCKADKPHVPELG